MTALQVYALAALIAATLLLAYVLYTRESRKREIPDWIVPGNGYGRHGYRSQKHR